MLRKTVISTFAAVQKACQYCTSRFSKHEPFIAKIGYDASENGPFSLSNTNLRSPRSTKQPQPRRRLTGAVLLLLHRVNLRGTLRTELQK